MIEKDKFDIRLEKELELIDTDEVIACDDKKAKRLLKKWYNNNYKEESITQYLPAIKNGLMRRNGINYSHNETIAKGKAICEKLTQKELAHAFIYGISHDAPEYRYPLVAYYYFINTPSHEIDNDKRLEKSTDKNIGNSKTLDKIKYCTICGYYERKRSVKTLFDSTNICLGNFYFGYPELWEMSLDSSLIYLEEYLKLPKVKSTYNDFNVFMNSISFICSLDNAYPTEIKEKLYKSKILPMTKEQVSSYLNMLGHLNILHHPNTIGIAKGATSSKDINDLDNKYNKKNGSEFTYPFRLFNTIYGVDFNSIDAVFSDIQEDY